MHSQKILIVLIILLVLLLSGCSTKEKYDLTCSDCNLIIINIELLRADYIGLYNKNSDATPNIDEFFEDSIIFTDVSASAGATYQSITSVFRGQESVHIKYIPFYDLANMTGWETRPKLIAEVLSENQWNTTYVNEGKRSGYYVHLDQGFSKYIDSYKDKDQTINISTKILDEWNNTNKSVKKHYLQIHNNQLHYSYFIPTTMISEEELESNIFTDISKKDKDTYLIGKHDREKFDGNQITISNDENNSIFNILYKGSGPEYEYFEKRKVDLEKEKEIVSNIYRIKVKIVDSELKDLFDKLEEEGYTENSIIILYANHGTDIGEQGIFNHGTVNQGSIHVPLMIKHPNIHEQIKINEPVSLVDLAQTIYNMTNIPHKTEGYSLTTLVNKQPYLRETIYGKGNSKEYIRKGNFKLINDPLETRLHNIKKDPYEQENIIDKFPKKARELQEELEKQILN